MKLAKRAFLILLCLSMLFSLSACGQKAQSESSAPATTAASASEYAEEKALLLQNWKDYLAIIENLYAHMNWSLGYLEAYAENGDWDSFLKAQAACSATLRYIRNVDYPLSYALTAEETMALDAIGIEAEVVQSEYLSFESTRERAAETLDVLFASLLYDAEYLPAYRQFQKNVKADQEQLTYKASYYCFTTNYLLIELGMEAEWDTFFVDCPTLAAAREDWISDKATLESKGREALDLYAKSLDTLDEALGVSDYINKLIQEAGNTKNWENLRKELQVPEGCPGYLPRPGFFTDTDMEDHEAYYYYQDPESGESVRISSGKSIPETPNVVLIQFPGVAKEEIDAYAQTLSAWGLPVAAQEDESDQSYSLFAREGNTKLIVEWTAEKTSFYMTQELLLLLHELELSLLTDSGQS